MLRRFVALAGRSIISRSASANVQKERIEFCCVKEGGYRSRCNACPFNDEEIADEEQKIWHSGKLTGQLAAVAKARECLGISEEEHVAWLNGDAKNLVKRRYMLLAKELHPDNPDGDAAKFRELVEAHELLLTTMSKA